VNDALVSWLMTPGAVDEPVTLEDFLHRPRWHAEALCRGLTGIFFSAAPANLARARAICEACPVRQKCFDYAMADPDLMGLWGGFTEKERRAMRRSSAA
jgi:WhiB family transcriptional regulator, redox-sensing transcriptional regulator